LNNDYSIVESDNLEMPNKSLDLFESLNPFYFIFKFKFVIYLFMQHNLNLLNHILSTIWSKNPTSSKKENAMAIAVP
jgi:hypothetical protein